MGADWPSQGTTGSGMCLHTPALVSVRSDSALMPLPLKREVLWQEFACVKVRTLSQHEAIVLCSARKSLDLSQENSFRGHLKLVQTLAKILDA